MAIHAGRVIDFRPLAARALGSATARNEAEDPLHLPGRACSSARNVRAAKRRCCRGKVMDRLLPIPVVAARARAGAACARQCVRKLEIMASPRWPRAGDAPPGLAMISKFSD